MDIITSSQNALVKQLVRLADSARERRQTGLTLLDGSHLLSALLDAGQAPQQVMVAAEREQDAEIAGIVARLDQEPQRMSAALFSRFTDLKTPSSIVATYAIPQLQPVEPSFGLWLDEVQDPGNVGSILRSAAAAGVDCVYLSPGCADPWSPKVLRAGMGAHFVLRIVVNADLPALAANWPGDLVVTALQGAQSLYLCPWQQPVTFIFGNEGSGVSAELLAAARHRVAIPMPGQVESLNVAAAAAICLFEQVRRRQAET